jgi:hypothetical protein
VYLCARPYVVGLGIAETCTRRCQPRYNFMHCLDILFAERQTGVARKTEPISELSSCGHLDTEKSVLLSESSMENPLISRYTVRLLKQRGAIPRHSILSVELLDRLKSPRHPSRHRFPSQSSHRKSISVHSLPQVAWPLLPTPSIRILRAQHPSVQHRSVPTRGRCA